MSKLNPDGWAFPGRIYKDWDRSLKIAYVLCFLHSKHINKVHILGSSSTDLIVLRAAAINLKMFHRISFDSTTWYSPMYRSKYYIDPRTLKAIPIQRYRDVNLKWYKSYTKYFHEHEISSKNQVLLFNVLSIHRFTEAMLQATKNYHNVQSFILSSKFQYNQRQSIIDALEMLKNSLDKGYNHIEKRLAFIWK